MGPACVATIYRRDTSLGSMLSEANRQAHVARTAATIAQLFDFELIFIEMNRMARLSL